MPQLTTISGFDALDDHWRCNLSIENNALLTDLPAFSTLTTIGGNFTVQDNALLSSCCGLLRFVDGTVAIEGDTNISGNATGCESGDAIIANCDAEPVVGLPAVDEGLRFYPNPAAQTLYIEGISQETSLIIRTLAGKTLLRTTLHQNQAIDLADLPQGTYILTLQNAQEQSTRRLVIGI